MKNLNNSKKKIYSQNGEDGIIEEILNRLVDNLDKTCCEFGAWDGMYLSNVYNLIKNKDYKALFIEADKNKFKKLNNNFDGKKIIALNKCVSFEGKICGPVLGTNIRLLFLSLSYLLTDIFLNHSNSNQSK